jgi:hypothetical protein
MFELPKFILDLAAAFDLADRLAKSNPVIALSILSIGAVVGFLIARFFGTSSKTILISLGAISAIVLVSIYVLPKLFEPAAHFTFANSDTYIMPPEQRQRFGLPGWRISLGFTSKEPLTDAVAWVEYGEQKRRGQWVKFFTCCTEERIMWDDVTHPYDAKYIPSNNLVLIVLLHYDDDLKLKMTNQRKEHPLFSGYQDIKPGEYRFSIRVDAKNQKSHSIVAHLHWFGDPKTFRIDLEKP